MASTGQTLQEKLEFQQTPNTRAATIDEATLKTISDVDNKVNTQQELVGASESDFNTNDIPNGGYGWIVVAAASIMTFWLNAMVNCWGVLQTALLNSTLSGVPTSTVSFVGSFNLMCGALFGIAITRLTYHFGSQAMGLAGIALVGLGLLAASWSTKNIGGLFATVGLMAGVGESTINTTTNSVAVQYFSKRLGLANGFIKLGGGVGGTVMAIAQDALVRKVGIAWTFRIQGLLTLSIGLPAAWLVKDRVSTKKSMAPAIDFSMFQSVPFTMIFMAGAIGTFALFVPPYYLPLFAQSLGLSSSLGAGLVAAFNASTAFGRFGSGPLCDKMGSANMFIVTMMLNTISMLTIWVVSNKLAPLIVFAILNGIANGAFFTVFPTVVARIFAPAQAAVAMSMSVTGWTLGYLLGAPIAGYLLQAAGGQRAAEERGVKVYRPAIFYAGGVTLVSCVFALVARIYLAKSWRQRV